MWIEVPVRVTCCISACPCAVEFLQPDALYVWNWNTVLRHESTFPLFTLVRKPLTQGTSELPLACLILRSMSKKYVCRLGRSPDPATPYCSQVGIGVFAEFKFGLGQVSCCGFLSHGSSGVSSSALLRLKVCPGWQVRPYRLCYSDCSCASSIPSCHGVSYFGKNQVQEREGVCSRSWLEATAYLQLLFVIPKTVRHCTIWAVEF